MACLRWPARASRWAYHELARALILLDLGCHRLVARALPPSHVLVGGCHRRGACCRQILLEPPAVVRRRPWAMAWLAAFHRVAHRFEVVGRTEGGGLVFACGHLTAAGRCGIYRYRPRLCRAYPALPARGPPRLLPGCGYRTMHRSAATMRPHRRLQVLGAHVSVHHPDPTCASGARALPTEEAGDFHLVAEPPP